LENKLRKSEEKVKIFSHNWLAFWSFKANFLTFPFDLFDP